MSDHLFEPEEPDEDASSTPIQVSRVYTSNTSQQWQQAAAQPAIKLIWTKEYSDVNKIAECDHLTDENWHKWKERMKRVFINSDITGYTTGSVK